MAVPVTALRQQAWAVGLVGAVSAVGFLVRAGLQGGVDGRGLGLAVVAVALLLVYAWLDADTDPEASQRMARYGGGAIALVLLAAGVTVGIYRLVRANDQTADWTSRAAFSLSGHGQAVLGTLQRDVELLGFFRHGTPGEIGFERQARAMAAAGSRLTFSLHDPLREPVLAEELGVTLEAGQVVVRSADRVEILSERRDEVALINAILRVTTDAEHRVCWSTGHGEAGADDDRDDRSMSAAVLALEGGDFVVRAISLLQGSIDPACEVLVLARPEHDLDERERADLARYLASGGAALVMLEPDAVPELAADLRRYGLALGPDVVLDPAPERRLSGVDDLSVMVFPRDAWLPHPLATGLSASVVLGLSRSVVPIDDPPGVRAHALFFTSAHAWAELRRTPGAEPVADADERSGEISVGASVEIDEPEIVLPGIGEAGRPGGRMVVLGDASFATNQMLDFGSNQELFLSALTWLVGEDGRLADRPAPKGDTIELTQQDLLTLTLLALVAGPAFGLVMGARLAWRRRRL